LSRFKRRASDFYDRKEKKFSSLTTNMSGAGKTFVVEHLDPELEQWSSLEYACIAKECHDTGSQFLLSSVPTSLKLPENLQHLQQDKILNVETRGIEEIYADRKNRVCLLDPAAAKDLSPEDGDNFDIFLFGGILGKS
jgi:ribosome biogenesis SPOUT family RNA methylase Rps3